MRAFVMIWRTWSDHLRKAYQGACAPLVSRFKRDTAMRSVEGPVDPGERLSSGRTPGRSLECRRRCLHEGDLVGGSRLGARL
jgi:hypothetical protein